MDTRGFCLLQGAGFPAPSWSSVAPTRGVRGGCYGQFAEKLHVLTAKLHVPCITWCLGISRWGPCDPCAADTALPFVRPDDAMAVFQMISFISHKITPIAQQEMCGAASAGLLNLGPFALNTADFPRSRWSLLLPFAALGAIVALLSSFLFSWVIFVRFYRFR